MSLTGHKMQLCMYAFILREKLLQEQDLGCMFLVQVNVQGDLTQQGSLYQEGLGFNGLNGGGMVGYNSILEGHYTGKDSG